MRKLAVFTGAFSCGIFLAQYLLPDTWLLPGAVMCLLTACLALFLPGSWRRRLLLAGVGLSLSLGWNWLYTRQVSAPMEALADTERRGAVMVLCDYAVPTNYGARAAVKLNGFPTGKAIYYGDSDLLELLPGQTITDDVRFQSAARIRDDDITSFTSKGVFLLAYSRGEPETGEGTASSLRWLPVCLGRAMRIRIGELFDGNTAAFLTAILTGDKSGLSAGAASDLSEAGLSHVLAVSGMHCGFLLTLVTLLAGQHRRRLLAGTTIPLLWFYALLTGCSPSVVRACVMLSFLLAAPLFRRNGDPPTAMAAALFFILLQNPFAAASISLQLSFGAVAGLLWLTPKLQRLLTGGKRWGRIFRILSASFSATMGALVFTVPLSAYYFGILVLVSPLSNLLCLWAASLVFLLGLPAVLLSFLFRPLGLVLGLVPRVLTGYILETAHILAALPYHALYFANPYLKYWLAYAYVLFAAAYLLKPKSRRKYALAAVLASLTLVLTVQLGQARYAAGLHIAVLDVGQGESVLLQDRGTFALVDCGSGNSWYDPGGIAADQLLTRGCRSLDYLALTHYDSDHVSGVETLLARLPVKKLLLPAAADDAGIRETVLRAAERRGTAVEYVEAESQYALGESCLTVYPPLGSGGDNEEGLAVLCTRGDYDLLITGDMNAATERKLLETFELPDIEALVAGHHGSKNSSSKELLEALKPETALISVGSNSYGHPADEALRRLAMAGAAICRTDKQGTITITVK